MAGAGVGGVGGAVNWEIGIDIHTLISIKYTTNKNLLYKKINKIKFKKNTKNYISFTRSLFMDSTVV